MSWLFKFALIAPRSPPERCILPTLDCSLLLRTTGAVPRVHGLEAGHQPPGCRSPTPTGPWEKPTVEEALESGSRTVSRRYLSSLKNKLSSGAWRKSYQPGTCPGSGTQVPGGLGKKWGAGGPSSDLLPTHSPPAGAKSSPGWVGSSVSRDQLKARFTLPPPNP